LALLGLDLGMTVVTENNLPIGIFDSGIGGLTVAKDLVDLLPNESIIYFGDTVHLPYGEKATGDIQSYARRITDFFLERGVKLILIACNTASAAAYEMLQDYIGSRALLVDIVNPVAKFLSKNYAGKRVGLIGTKFTIESHVYSKRLSEFGGGIRLSSLATPSLASVIENEKFDHGEIDAVLYEYLSSPILRGIDALILGCTHYSIVKDRIADFYRHEVDIIDTSKITADEVSSILVTQKLLSSVPPKRSFYVSKATEDFLWGVKQFFGDEIVVESLNIF
jgi:glutamate racemase